MSVDALDYKPYKPMNNTKKLWLVNDGIFPIIYNEERQLINQFLETGLKSSLTLQGEGKFLGVPSLFLRTSMCNLRCLWDNKNGLPNTCDTSYSSFKPERNPMDIDIIARIIRNNIGNAKHLVITGGEPVYQAKGILQLMDSLTDLGLVYTIETNGSVYNEELFKRVQLISFSPKLKSSNPTKEKLDQLGMKLSPILIKQHDIARQRAVDTVRKAVTRCGWNWKTDMQVKFVVTDRSDLDCIKEEFLDKIPHLKPSQIYLMPEGITRADLALKQMWVIEECIKHGYNFAQRLHIEIWGEARSV